MNKINYKTVLHIIIVLVSYVLLLRGPYLSHDDRIILLFNIIILSLLYIIFYYVYNKSSMTNDDKIKYIARVISTIVLFIALNIARCLYFEEFDSEFNILKNPVIYCFFLVLSLIISYLFYQILIDILKSLKIMRAKNLNDFKRKDSLMELDEKANKEMEKLKTNQLERDYKKYSK